MSKEEITFAKSWLVTWKHNHEYRGEHIPNTTALELITKLLNHIEENT